MWGLNGESGQPGPSCMYPMYPAKNFLEVGSLRGLRYKSPDWSLQGIYMIVILTHSYQGRSRWAMPTAAAQLYIGPTYILLLFIDGWLTNLDNRP